MAHAMHSHKPLAARPATRRATLTTFHMNAKRHLRGADRRTLCCKAAASQGLLPQFIGHVQEVKDDLSVFQNKLQSVQAALQSVAPHDVQPLGPQQVASAFNSMFNKHIQALNELHEERLSHLPTSDRRAHGEYLRQQCAPFIEQAPFMHRANVKPRGYQGDSEMMCMLYKHEYEGDSLLGQLLHKHIIDTPAAQAVRNRRRLITSTLQSQAAQQEGVPMQLLSVACGPAHEMADILQCGADLQSYSITLLDQDGEALGEARDSIQAAEQRCGGPAKVNYVQSSVLKLLRPTSQTRRELGQFNFIYSMGLYDYLDEKTAKALTAALYSMLAPGGTLLLGNYSVNNPTKTYMEYWCDWPLEYRTEQQMRELLPAELSPYVEVGYEPAAAQMFLRAHKPATIRIPVPSHLKLAPVEGQESIITPSQVAVPA